MIYISIETVRASGGPESVYVDASAITVPKTYKKPDSIERYRADKLAEERQSAWRASPLDPWLGGEVFCVGVSIDGSVSILSKDTEAETLEVLQRGLISKKNQQRGLCAWNGLGFVYPFLSTRALIHGHSNLAALTYRDRPYPSKRLLDPMRSIPGGHSRRTLAQVATMLGYDPAQLPQMRGEEVQPAYDDGLYLDIEERCRARLQALAHVGEHMEAAAWLITR